MIIVIVTMMIIINSDKQTKVTIKILYVIDCNQEVGGGGDNSQSSGMTSICSAKLFREGILKVHFTINTYNKLYIKGNGKLRAIVTVINTNLTYSKNNSNERMQT